MTADLKQPGQHNCIYRLPLKLRFKVSKLYVSAIPVVGLGAFIGLLSAVMGVGGGFIMAPAMIYLLRVPTNVVIGTSLFQIIFVTAYTTIIEATANQTVDIVLAVLLMIGGVIGAQYGASAGQRLRGEQLRALSGAAGPVGGAAAGVQPVCNLRTVFLSSTHWTADYEGAPQPARCRVFPRAACARPGTVARRGQS